MTPQQSPSRFLSLDVFRGLTICFMIIVNTPGGGATPFAPLLHADWHGFTPTDLVFPSFLFAVGNAMSFSAQKFAVLPESVVLSRIFKRTLILFLLGYLMYWFPFFRVSDAGEVSPFPISQTRIFGVLQRIALCYGIGSLLVYYFSFRKVLLVSLLLLVGYYFALLGFGDPADPFSLQGNAALIFDRWVMGEDHLYHDRGVIFDPEGFLSTFPAIVNVIVGYYAGVFIQKKGNWYECIAKLLLTSALFILLALMWNSFFPINKKLWTSSFVLLTTGLDLGIMAALLFMLEVKQWIKPAATNFFVIPGKNPLFIYLLSELLLITLFLVKVEPGKSLFDLLSGFFQAFISGPLGSLAFAVAYLLLCWMVAYLLDRKKIYIRI